DGRRRARGAHRELHDRLAPGRMQRQPLGHLRRALHPVRVVRALRSLQLPVSLSLGRPDMSANPQHQKAYRGIRYRIRTKKGQTPKAYYLEVYTSASAAFSSRRFGPYVSRVRAEAALRAMVDEEYEKAEAQNERLRRHLQGRSAMGRASRWGGSVARL